MDENESIGSNGNYGIEMSRRNGETDNFFDDEKGSVWTRSHIQSSHDNDEDDDFDDDSLDALWSSEATKRINFRCWGIVLSSLLLTILLAISGLRETWTLTAGETRSTISPIMNRKVTISLADPSARTSLDAKVYSLSQGCPPLDGKPVVLEDDHQISLDIDDYRFDPFYLNTGSFINVTVQPFVGMSEVYIMQGPSAIQRLEEHANADSFQKEVVQKITASADDNITTTMTFEVRQSDLYALVYDSPPSDNANSSDYRVSYTIHSTTYNLHGHKADCTTLLQQDCVLTRVTRGSCVLVQAEKSKSSTQMTVRLRASRRLLLLLIYGLLPYAIAMTLAHFCKPKSSYQAVGEKAAINSDEPNDTRMSEGNEDAHRDLT